MRPWSLALQGGCWTPYRFRVNSYFTSSISDSRSYIFVRRILKAYPKIKMDVVMECRKLQFSFTCSKFPQTIHCIYKDEINFGISSNITVVSMEITLSWPIFPTKYMSKIFHQSCLKRFLSQITTVILSSFWNGSVFLRCRCHVRSHLLSELSHWANFTPRQSSTDWSSKSNELKIPQHRAKAFTLQYIPYAHIRRFWCIKMLSPPKIWGQFAAITSKIMCAISSGLHLKYGIFTFSGNWKYQDSKCFCPVSQQNGSWQRVLEPILL